jgi:hypothetical protein
MQKRQKLHTAAALNCYRMQRCAVAGGSNPPYKA